MAKRRKGGRGRKGAGKKGAGKKKAAGSCKAISKKVSMAGRTYGLHGKRVSAFGRRKKTYRVFARKCT